MNKAHKQKAIAIDGEKELASCRDAKTQKEKKNRQNREKRGGTQKVIK